MSRHECDCGAGYFSAQAVIDCASSNHGRGFKCRSCTKLKAQNAELLEALTALLAQHDRPHGFDDESWYAREVAKARDVIAKVQR